jgi:hypothetical protein
MYAATPRLTPHARQRAAEMDVGTKLIKRLVRDHDLRVNQPDGRVLLKGRVAPGITLIVEDRADVSVVITVLWNTQDVYTRPAVAA